jgi:short-subunit dehydrogenase
MLHLTSLAEEQGPCGSFEPVPTTAIVTGATRGIGRGVAEALVASGARVGCIARSGGDLDELRASVSGPGAVEVVAADLSRRDEAEAAVGTLTAALGPVDLLVNNAGVGQYGPVLDLDPEDAERLIRINYLSVVYTTAAVLPAMAERRSGQIVNVASIAGRLGAPFEAAYSASKFAVVGFSEALSIEAAAFGVRVSVVNPGPVDTEFFARRGHPYERESPKPIAVAEAVAAVLAAVDTGRFETTVPTSLKVARLTRALLPRLYFLGARRAFHPELSALASRAGAGVSGARRPTS